MKKYKIKECTAYLACGKFFATYSEAAHYIEKEKFKYFIKQIIFSDEKFAGFVSDVLISDLAEKILENKEKLFKF